MHHQPRSMQRRRAPLGGTTCLDAVVTQSGLTSPDHSGWLLDLSSGARRWCVIADMLFCIFQGRREEKPCQVIMLPGHVVGTVSRHQEAYSDSQDSESHFSSHVMSRKSCFQFGIVNPISGYEYKFRTDSLEDGETWVGVLKAATSLDTTVASDLDIDVTSSRVDSYSDETLPVTKDVQTIQFAEVLTKKPPLSNCISSSPFMPPTPNHRRTRSADITCGSPRAKVQRSSLDPAKDEDIKVYPEPAFAQIIRHSSFNNVSDLTRSQKNNDVQNVGAHLRRIGSLDSVKCTSPPTNHPHAIPSQSPKAFFQRFRSKSSEHPRESNAMNELFSLKRSSSSSNQKGLGHSSGGKKLGSKLVRKASSLKDKVLGRTRLYEDSPRLGTLSRVQVSGFLHHRHILKWSKLWCVVSGSNFYCFKSANPKESPELHLPLTDCTIRLVENEKSKKYAFKICYLDARSTYLAAVDAFDFQQWMKVLKKESRACEGKCAYLVHRNSTDSTMSQASVESSGSSASAKFLEGSAFHKTASLMSNDEEGRTSKHGDENGNDFSIKDSNSCSSSSSSGFIEPSFCSPSSIHVELPLSSPDYCWIQSDPNHTLVSPSSEYRLGRDWVDSDSDFMETTNTDDEMIPTPKHKLWGSSHGHQVGTPKHDVSLQQVWKRDKNYQLQRLKARVATLPNRPSRDIFNRHLPGPYGEGLLLVGDEAESGHIRKASLPNTLKAVPSPVVPSPDVPNHYVKNSRTKSTHHSRFLARHTGLSSRRHPAYSPMSEFSSPKGTVPSPVAPEETNSHCNGFTSPHTSSLTRHCESSDKASSPRIGPLHYFQEPRQRRSMSDGHIKDLEKLLSPRKPARVAIAARDITEPSMAGYLDRKTTGKDWTSCWCVLKGDKLILYEAPIDDVSIDTIHLPGYEVRVVQGEKNRVSFELSHPMRPTEVFSAETPDVQEVWLERLRRVIDKVSLEGLNLEEGRSRELGNLDQSPDCSITQEWERDLLRQRKCKLLAAVLKQKKELERRQAQKSPEDITSPTLPQEESILPPPPEFGSNPESDRTMKEVLKLKQKKISVQLKVDCLQKQLQPTSTKGGIFQKKLKLPLSFGREKKSADLISDLIGSSGADASNLEAQLDVMKTELAVVNKRLEDLQQFQHSRSTEIVFKSGCQADSLKVFPAFFSDRPRSHTTGLGRSFTKRGSDPCVSLKSPPPCTSFVTRGETKVLKRVASSDGTCFNYSASKPAVPDMSALIVPKVHTPTNKTSSTNGPQTASISRGVKLTTQYGVKNCSTTPLRLRYSWSEMQEGAKSFSGDHLALSRTSSDGPASNPRLRHALFSDTDDQESKDQEGAPNRAKSASREINPAALAQIAAFEELIQAKMHKS